MSEVKKEPEKQVVDPADLVDRKELVAQPLDPVDKEKLDVSELERVKAHNVALLADLKKAKIKNQKFEADAEKARKEQLEKQEEFKTLYEQEKEQNLKKNELIKEQELRLIAKDMQDPELVLVYKDSFEFDENLKTVNGEEVIKKLKDEKPYLFKSDKKPMGGHEGSNPVYKPDKVFTAEEIGKMSMEEFSKNKKEINRQYLAGMIK